MGKRKQANDTIGRIHTEDRIPDKSRACDEGLIDIEYQTTSQDLTNQILQSKRSEENRWTTVRRKNKVIPDANQREMKLGVKLVQIGKKGTTTYHPQDITMFFKILAQVDPMAIILNHKKDIQSAMAVHDIATTPNMDYVKYLDMRTDGWGGPVENKTRTIWMCYIATETLTPNLRDIRENRMMQQYLNQGNVTLQYTKLQESNSRILCHVAHKDPQHTNRIELEQRLQEHLNQYSTNEISMTLYTPLKYGSKRQKFSTRICTAVVGGKDNKKAEEILRQHPFEDLKLIMFVWRQQDINGYTNRLKDHEEIIGMSQAIKLDQVDVHEVLPYLKTTIQETNMTKIIVDVSPASHAAQTGTVYVQYLQPYREEATSIVRHCVANIKEMLQTTIVQFPNGPILREGDSSVQPTLQSKDGSSYNTQ
jgi:hypothetical protein